VGRNDNLKTSILHSSFLQLIENIIEKKNILVCKSRAFVRLFSLLKRAIDKLLVLKELIFYIIKF